MQWADKRLHEAHELVREVRAEFGEGLARFTLEEAADAIEIADCEVEARAATTREG